MTDFFKGGGNQYIYQSIDTIEQWLATGGPRAKTGPPAIISDPQPDYFERVCFWNKSIITETVTHNQSMWAERGVEQCDFY